MSKHIINNKIEYVRSTEPSDVIMPYINNMVDNKKITGLIYTSLGGTILTTPYRRPDPQTPNGVFDYNKTK